MVAVSLWTRPPAVYLCTGPLKIPFIPTPPRRAARTTWKQRILNSSSCEISTVSFTTAPGIQHDLRNRDIDHPTRTATAKSQWSTKQAGPWESTSASRQGNRRRLIATIFPRAGDCLHTNGNCGNRTTNATGTSTTLCKAKGNLDGLEQKSHGTEVSLSIPLHECT